MKDKTKQNIKGELISVKYPWIFLYYLWILIFPAMAEANTKVVYYPVNPDHKSDGMVTGEIEGRKIEFEYQHTYHFSSKGKKDFKSNYIRLAAGGSVHVLLSIKKPVSIAHLRTVGKDLAFSIHDSEIEFTLPGPGHYYLQLPELNVPGRMTYTIFFFIDDLHQYYQYKNEFSRALNVKEKGIVSSRDINQTSGIQQLINQYPEIYFPEGIYRTEQLVIPSDRTVLLGEGAVLKGTEDYNKEDKKHSRFIYIKNARNVRLAGLGTIDANGNVEGNQGVKGHLADVENSKEFFMDGLVLRNSNSWMIHLRHSKDVDLQGLHLFSGKDGIDPDGSVDVHISNTTIQSIDDAFAIKSKFEGESCRRIYMENCIVFSCASSLKVGTENYYGIVNDITWDNIDAVDADRGIILYTNASEGKAPVQNIIWRNIRVFNFNWEAETGGAPIQLENRYGGRVHNLCLENVVAYPTTDCSIKQPVEAKFKNVIIKGQSQLNDTSNIKLNGVIWEGVKGCSFPVVFIEPAINFQNSYYNGEDVIVDVIHPMNKEIKSVELFINGQWYGRDRNAPYTFSLKNLRAGNYVLIAKATDQDDRENFTAPKKVMIFHESCNDEQRNVTQKNREINEIFTHWPPGSSPEEIGMKVAKRFIDSPHPNFLRPLPPPFIRYTETCTWYGALTFADLIHDEQLQDQLSERFEPLFGDSALLVPEPDHVDKTVFGAIPFELYMQTGKSAYRDMGLHFAENQWIIPPDSETLPERKKFAEGGYSWQTRLWIDDMFMITLIQTQAYRATGNIKYLDRASKEMVLYLDKLQRSNGLFFHSPESPFFWGRGNGWMAAGMTEMLRSMPVSHKHYQRIMKGYQKMMASLIKYQDESGMWKQLIDEEESWPESSSTGMFTFAFITGVKNGWLHREVYGQAARKAWLALISYLNEEGNMTQICEGTNKSADRDYYINRKRLTGDMHGQAPVLWCASAFLR